jgi:hypothetical protein
MMEGLAAADAEPRTVMIDAPSLNAHRTAWPANRPHKGGMNSNLHAVGDANGRPLSFFMTAGQVSDYTGAAALLDDLLKAQRLLGDRGSDADWFPLSPCSRSIARCYGTTSTR